MSRFMVKEREKEGRIFLLYIKETQYDKIHTSLEVLHILIIYHNQIGIAAH